MLPTSVKEIFYAKVNEIMSNEIKIYLVCYEKDFYQNKYISIYELDIEINLSGEKRIKKMKSKEKMIIDNGQIENLTIESTDKTI